MKKIEISIIVLSAICYVVGILSIIKGEEPTAVLFVCAESIFLGILAYLFAMPKKSEEENKDIDDELILNMEQDLTEHKQRINALEKELEEGAKANEASQNDWDKEKESLLARIEELENGEVQEMAESFLPPVGENEEDVETIDIISTAKRTAEELSDFAKEARLDIEVSTPHDKLLVRGNESRMRIMFKNIMDNSIKYMNKAGKLVITISRIGDDIFIVLKDNGDGLGEDETKHIFELNYQGSNRISGNGLGLTQAKAIVDYYGGTIYAKSNKNRGMGIYIQLPTT